MTASINVGIKTPLIVDQKRIDTIIPTNEPKLFDATGRQLLHLGNQPSSRAALALHAPLVPMKNISVNDQSGGIENKKNNRQINRDGHAEVALFGIFADGISDFFNFLRRLASGNAHDLHQFRRHFSGYLILNATFAVGVGCKKSQNLFLGNSSAIQAVEKFSIANTAAQFIDSRHKTFAIPAHSRHQPGTLSAVCATSHNLRSSIYV
jgi:hypothetical protein